VSFQKGCYPGQEIVARSQYLGKLKRRMYLAHTDSSVALVRGTELYSRDLDGQPSGMVVSAATAPGGGFDLLAVIQTTSAASHPIHIGTPEGPVLQLEPLPYRVP
jgi:folate-binding Fe-S cluster repair protein YgfZ